MAGRNHHSAVCTLGAMQVFEDRNRPASSPTFHHPDCAYKFGQSPRITHSGAVAILAVDVEQVSAETWTKGNVSRKLSVLPVTDKTADAIQADIYEV